MLSESQVPDTEQVGFQHLNFSLVSVSSMVHDMISWVSKIVQIYE